MVNQCCEVVYVIKDDLKLWKKPFLSLCGKQKCPVCQRFREYADRNSYDFLQYTKGSKVQWLIPVNKKIEETITSLNEKDRISFVLKIPSSKLIPKFVCEKDSISLVHKRYTIWPD